MGRRAEEGTAPEQLPVLYGVGPRGRRRSEGAGPWPPRWSTAGSESPATTASSASQPCMKDREDRGVWQHQKRINPAAPKE